MKKFNEVPLPEKEDFYSKLYMEDISDSDYVHAKRVCKDFKIKKVVEYRDLYHKRDTLLLPDAFENFRKMCFEIY